MRTLLLILGYLIADSALTDPCEHHTVLDQPWRSTDCIGTQCTGQKKCDWNLYQGWYRFKSSGGWEIPETVVPKHHCSTEVTGWLKGAHPSVGQGEVARTVCLTGDGNPCSWTREIKIKNCTSYFVYELKPTVWCYTGYCTDPTTVPNQEPEEQWTRESAYRTSSIPLVSTASDPETTPAQGSDAQTMRNSTDRSSTIPAGSAVSGPETTPAQESDAQTMRKSSDRSSTIPAGSAVSDPETTPAQQSDAETMRKSTDRSSTIPAGSAVSGPETTPAQETYSQTMRKSTDRSSTILAGSAVSDPETSPTQEPEEQSTRESAYRTSTIPAGSAASDTETSPTEKPEEKYTRETADLSSTVPAGSATSDIKYQRINVQITSMTELDDETAKRIVVERVKMMLKDQCPNEVFDLSPDDVQCSASHPLEE